MSRILTTHVGSLPRPAQLIELFTRGAPADELQPGIRQAVADVVARQRELGIDVVNDGEYGKPVLGEVDYAAFTRYRYERLSGYELVEAEESKLFTTGRDRRDYADFYASGEAAMSSDDRQVVARNVGPIAYVGHDQVRRDIENLKAALDGSEAGAFMPVIAAHDPGSVGEHYATAEDEGEALAAALHEEYKLITDAGIAIQVDDARLVAHFEGVFSIDWDLKGFRAWAERHIALINRTLQGIPPELVRYHMCWGSWKGPHSSDLPLAEVVDLVLRIDASQYSIEAGNPQHEHEWAVWQDTKLPDGKQLIPGVVTHKTNVIEHPEVVAQRLVRYADVVGRENVIAGTDCGMGGRIHPQLAWGKLQALVDGAQLASQRLWP